MHPLKLPGLWRFHLWNMFRFAKTENTFFYSLSNASQTILNILTRNVKKTWIGKKWNQRPIWESEEMLHNKKAKEILQQMASRMNPSQKVGLVHTAATIREDLKGKYSFIDNFQLFSFIHHFCCVKNILLTKPLVPSWFYSNWLLHADKGFLFFYKHHSFL